MKSSRAIAFLTLLFVAATSHGAWACATCWGDTSGSKSSHAAAVGIGAMVVLMLAMLSSIAAFGWHLAWRAKHPLPDYDELLADDPAPGDSTPKS
jgi:succinate dehydrogenase hydrophobic anchor subunit